MVIDVPYQEERVSGNGPTLDWEDASAIEW